MKFRRAVAFAFLAGLALAVLAVGTGVLAAQVGSFSAAGEVICGERAAAEGFTLRQELALGGHLSVDAVFDAASGETRSDSAWSFLELAPEEAPAGPKLRLKGVGGDRDESWPDRGHNTLGAPLAWAQDIYDRLYSSLDGESGQAGESRPLSEYTDKLPLNFYCRGMTDDVPVYEIRPEDPRLWCDRRVNETYDGELSDGAFALPLTGDEMLYASVTVNSYACAFGVEASPGDGYYYTYSDCVLAPDGALYLVLDIRETDGGTPGERVSAEGFPGGEWCVWRIPCEVEGNTGGERRWTADSVRVRPDFGSVECFRALGADWEHADLELSCDGTRLLLFTVAFLVVALISKILGCGGMARLCGFSNKDSLKIGMGMMNRGEVALIVAQKGLLLGLLNPMFFASVIILILVSAIVTPIFLKLLYHKDPPPRLEADPVSWEP